MHSSKDLVQRRLEKQPNLKFFVLSSDLVIVFFKCCFYTQRESRDHQGQGAQDVHLDFHNSRTPTFFYLLHGRDPAGTKALTLATAPLVPEWRTY